MYPHTPCPKGGHKPPPRSHTRPQTFLPRSADALFTRAGVVKPGAAGSLGHAPAAAGAGAAGGGRTTKSPGGGEASSKVRRCTIKRIHVEIHRVLSEAASFREFKIALSACVRGGGGGGRGEGTRIRTKMSVVLQFHRW